MSYNRNFYNNQYGNEFTFQSNFAPPFVPPPPPPAFYLQPAVPPGHTSGTNISDQDFIKRFENKVTEGIVPWKPKLISLNKVCDRLKNLVTELNEIKEQEKELSEKIKTCSDDEWENMLSKINHKKDIINKCLSEINDSHLDELRMLLVKRSAKRMRLKRLRTEKNREKEERIKLLKERSRKIDEHLQKIKDSINKAKLEEEAKLQADIVLKEVLRKKHDARKFINKFDALMKLHKARQNTAKGRGENVSQMEVEEFVTKIDNLKALWIKKLVDYEKEESELRKKLENSAGQKEEINEAEKEVADNLAQWKEVLFGDENASPQFNFNGDLNEFIATRWQWDQYLNPEGTSIPVGWVVPLKPARFFVATLYQAVLT